MKTFGRNHIRTVILALSLSIATLFGTSVSADADTGSGQVNHIYMEVPAKPGVDTSNGYRAFIESLRAAAGHLYRGDTYIAQRYAGGIIRADLNGVNGQGTGALHLRLWMDPQNLYVLGFTGENGQTLYFNDLAQSEINRMTSAVREQGFTGQVSRLPYGSNYNSLRVAAGRGREAMQISHHDIYSAILDLATTDPQNVRTGIGTRNSARSLSLLIQVLSEAARFNDVFGVMRAAFRGASRLPRLPEQLQSLENNWAAMSSWGTAVTNNGSAAPRTVAGAGPLHDGRPTDLVLRQWSDAARYLAMMLGNFNLPTEPPGGKWGHTEL
ncbi:ribosome-inactivating family protein [Streptomyces sp. NPDC094038]|uniref:ribosome-inactivating family protein n=1 Tax=Streptomyces sp. NPDC094038 TaxID=3366055 RepID=UPI0037F32E9E